MIPAGKLGGRSGRKGDDTQKKTKIKNRASGNMKACWDTVHSVLILQVSYTEKCVYYGKVQIHEMQSLVLLF